MKHLAFDHYQSSHPGYAGLNPEGMQRERNPEQPDKVSYTTGSFSFI